MNNQPSPPPPNPLPLSIVTWNVAGWRGTFWKIKSRHSSFPTWLAQTDWDILCLQEVKIQTDEFATEPTRYGALTPGYEAFFCCPTKDKITGVATFCRNGMVREANRKLMGGIRDETGRFLETNHGTFSLINVYVPFDGDDYKNLPFKMNFLLALSARMKTIREEKKHPVILAGDLNIVCRIQDSPPEMRTVHLDRLTASTPSSNEPRLVTRLRTDFAKDDGMQRFRDALRNVTAELAKSKYYFCLGHGGTRLNVESSESPSLHRFSLEEAMKPASLPLPVPLPEYMRDAMDETGKYWILRRKNTLSVNVLLAVAQHVFHWSSYPRQDEVVAFASCTSDWLEGAGSVCGRTWGANVSITDHMIDTFAMFHGSAQRRWTIWNQSINERYENKGSKIDYVFVDHVLQRALIPPSRPLYGCTCAQQHALDGSCAWSGESALRAATAHGDFSPAPMEGGGIPEPPLRAFQVIFRKPVQTEIMYTAPWFSDHVAVSCVLNCRPPIMTLAQDAETMSCRPHFAQKAITSFFSKKITTVTDIKGDDDDEVSIVRMDVAAAAAAPLSSSTSSTTTSGNVALFPVFRNKKQKGE